VRVSSSNWIRPVILAVSCLIIGFVGGWSLSNVGGDSVSLPEANVDVTVQRPAPATTTVAPVDAQVPARDAVVVQVLNGTGRAGLAASTTTRLKGLGYAKVSTGNTSSQSGATVVYFREGSRAAAERLAADLKVATVTAIAGTPLASGASGSAQVVVVLGTS
jgi:hypothetical protein